MFAGATPQPQGGRKHNHYFKDVRDIDHIDVYRVLLAFNVTDPCLQHAIKKLLVAGGRGAGKDIHRDVKEAIDSLERWNEMRAEEAAALMLQDDDEGRVLTEVGSAIGRAFKRMADGFRKAFAPEPTLDTVVNGLQAAGVPMQPVQPGTGAGSSDTLVTPACKGMNCGCTDGRNHSTECEAEHSATVAGGTFVPGRKHSHSDSEGGQPD